jgi:hypothetical protein
LTVLATTGEDNADSYDGHSWPISSLLQDAHAEGINRRFSKLVHEALIADFSLVPSAVVAIVYEDLSLFLQPRIQASEANIDWLGEIDVQQTR